MILMSKPKIQCQACGQSVRYEAAQAGQNAPCPACGAQLHLPAVRVAWSRAVRIYLALALPLILLMGGTLVLTHFLDRPPELVSSPGPARETRISHSHPTLGPGGPVVLTGTLPEDWPLTPEGQTASLVIYHLRDARDDVGQVVHRDSLRVGSSEKVSLELPLLPSAPRHYRAELLVNSEGYAPLMGRSEWREESQAQLLFVPPLELSRAVHVHGTAMDLENGKPVPHVGFYLDAKKTLFARADEQGQFDFYIEPASGRFAVLAWLRTYGPHMLRGAGEPGGDLQQNLAMKRPEITSKP